MSTNSSTEEQKGSTKQTFSYGLLRREIKNSDLLYQGLKCSTNDGEKEWKVPHSDVDLNAWKKNSVDGRYGNIG